jgi:simple sugar transport system ATP-binding protein
MDEPTSVLTPQEVQILFKTLLKIKSEGRSILYISHKLEEIRKLCDTATILRLGKKVETCTPRKTSSNELAEMMVGSSIQIPLQKKTRDRQYTFILGKYLQQKYQHVWDFTQ